jgi:nucleoside-diphosphate-sugar epimerase
MRVRVTRAVGFIGSTLTDRLLAYDVTLPLHVEGPLDWVLHFASPASPPKYLAHPIETLRANSEGTSHLLELARHRGANFLLASSSEVYGDPETHPQPEAYWGNVNPNGCRSVYDEAKRYAEALTMAYDRMHLVNTRIIRIFTTHGPRLDLTGGRVVTTFITQTLRGEPRTVYGDGSHTPSFQYIDDLVEGMMRLMWVEHHGPVNLGNPEEYSVLALAYLVKEITESPSPIVFKPLPQDDPKQRRPDISRAKELLHWEPNVPVRERLMRAVDYCRDALRRPSRGGV